MVRKPNTVGDNAGLALARFVPWPKEEKTRGKFFDDVEATPVSAVYQQAFERWKTTFDQKLKERKAIVCTATLGGPLAVGLGNGSATEVGLTLHHTYGTPLIPGSAIKGACKNACRRAIVGQDEATKALFGTTDEAGYAIFHDAWLVSTTGKEMPLQIDTVTVHHPDYYQTQKSFPTDFDDPNPVPFISVKPGTQFLFAIEVPGADEGWLTFAEAMLMHALTEIGLGGKTNAGYGWFKESDLTFERPPVVLTTEQKVALYEARLASMQANQMDTNALVSEAKEIGTEAVSALKARLVKLGRWNKQTVDKPWRKAIEEVLQ